MEKREDEIDLVELFQKLWKGRRTVIKFLFIFGVIGLFIAIFSPKEYTAKTIMIPSMSDKKLGGNLSSLASMAGLSIDKVSKGEIPPAIYPQIVNSMPFRKKLLNTKISIEGVKQKITYQKYYQEFYKPGVLAWLKQYTIGLPGVIIQLVKGDARKIESSSKEKEGILFVSFEEEDLFEQLASQISIDVNDKEGYITLEANMPEPLAAAELTKIAQTLLREYIIDFKSKKATEELVFIKELYNQKEKEFQKADLDLASFKDRNQNVITATVALEEKRLEANYSLKLAIFSDLAKQLEAKKIQVKENTPIFTIVEPVSVPIRKSKPNRPMILIIWVFLGIVVGIGVVFGREWLKSLKSKNRNI